jgi:hypothetical protein
MLIIFLTLCVAMLGLIAFSDNIDKTRAARSRSLITFEVIDALIDIIFIERRHQLHTFQVILDDKEEVLAEVDSLLFQRGEFPGSVLEMNDRDYNACVASSIAFIRILTTTSPPPSPTCAPRSPSNQPPRHHRIPRP